MPDELQPTEKNPRAAEVTPVAPPRNPSNRSTAGRIRDGADVGGLSANFKPSIPTENLSGERLIQNAPRVDIGGTLTPMLGGIPLLAKLGQGGMGAVYYGVHPRLEMEVAIKVLPFHLAEQNPDMIKRFFREAKIAAKVRSPHLISVTDVNEEHGLYFLVMEFVHGESAGSALKRAQTNGQAGLPESVALEICIAATQGLAAAHAQGIIHRDIKPDNIMIPRRSTPGANDSSFEFVAAKLADLGLARGEGVDVTLTGTHSAMGTPGYMSPEQIEDARHCGKPADVFSTGVTLYALLAGRSPFAGESFMKIARATIETPHKSMRTVRGDVSDLTSRLIDHCLAKKADKRFADASALLAALKLCREKLGEPEQTLVKAAKELTQLRSAAEVGLPVPLSAPDHGQATPPARTKTTAAAQTAPSPATAAMPVGTANRKTWPVVAAALLALAIGGYFVREKYNAGTPRAGRLTDSAKEKREQAEPTPADAVIQRARDDADQKTRAADALNEENRKAALEALADLEALRGQVDKAESDLKGAAAGDPVLAKLKTLCDENAVGGPKRTEAEKAFSRGKTDQADKNYPDAIKEFRESQQALQRALQFRKDAEAALREQAHLVAVLEKTLPDRNADEKPYYAAAEKQVKDALTTVSGGDAMAARKLLAAAKTAFDEADRKVSLRRDAASAQQQAVGLAAVPKFAPDLRAGDDALAAGDAAAREGQWAAAAEQLKTAQSKYRDVFEAAKKEVAGLLVLARDQSEKKNFTQALGTLEILLLIDGQNGEARTLKAGTEGALRYEAALNDARQLLAKETIDAEGRYSKLSTAARTQIEAALKRAQDEAPGDAVAANLLSKLGGLIVAADGKSASLDLGNGVKLDLVLIPAGIFTMGSPANEQERVRDEGPQHEVAISSPFFMGKYDVTVKQFRQFAADTAYKTDAEKEGKGYTLNGDKWEEVAGASWKNPGFNQNDNHPVCLISWNDANAYCDWVIKKAGCIARLPRESEWEYACRAGTTTPFFIGESISTYQANYDDGNRKQTTEVGTFNANAFGLYDMSGNVWQWCEDWYNEKYYESSPKKDPRGPATGTARVLRGGSWNDDPWGCRSARRGGNSPGGRDGSNGFRIVVSMAP